MYFCTDKLIIHYKLTIMNKEIKTTEIKFKRQISSLLSKILDKHQVSAECLNCIPDNPLFDTTCDYVDLRHDIFTLSETLRRMADYQEMLLD